MTSPDDRHPTAETAFHAALELNGADREAYLVSLPDGIASSVRALLDADARTDSDTLAGPFDSTAALVGTTIGRYRLLEQIGEGGFGVVFMAEQREPVRRRVALKLIKRGMDTRQVIARFEAERQALAMMDHANIARVFDAGETDDGRPYFVMELVRGDSDHRVLRSRADVHARTAGAVPGCVSRGPARAPEGHHPS